MALELVKHALLFGFALVVIAVIDYKNKII